jgi:hypothetical protein
MTYWSWILATIGVTGMFMVGQKTLRGWVVLFCNECLWISYSIQSHQYGFIIMALSYMIVYTRSYLEWKKNEFE